MVKNFGDKMNTFLILWIGQLISTIGSGMTAFGLSVYMFGETGSATMVALVALCSFLPGLVLSVPCGALADRYDRRALMMIGDGLSAFGVALIFIAIVCGLPLWCILLGAVVSSAFSSFLEPAFKATISDVLTKEEYAKASGLNGITSGARFIVSPLLAALILSVSSIKLVLVLDILTFIPTFIGAWVVRKRLKKGTRTENKKVSLLTGFRTIKKNRGIFVLTFYTALLTLFMGTFQILSEPMVLSFSTSMVLSVLEVICASGMLVSSIILSKRGVKGSYRRTLVFSLFIAGLGMVGFGITMRLTAMAAFGFVFFLTIPYANTALDYLVRSNMDRAEEGSAWGAIGFISQLGYVVSYSTSGLLADTTAKLFDMSVGKGCAIMIMVSGIFLAVLALPLGNFDSIRRLEK